MFHKIKILKFFMIIVLFLYITANLYSSRNPELDLLINHINNEIHYNFSRKYSSYIIDKYLLDNPELISQTKIHENELLYIQIEDKETVGVDLLKKIDFERNVVLNDEYYYSIVKPYSYIYLGFSLLNDFSGFFTLHYFVESSLDGIENYMSDYEKLRILDINIENEFSVITTNINYSFRTTSQNNKSHYFFEKSVGSLPENVYDNSFMIGSLYEVRMLKPYGIFYRKISLDYIYEYIKNNIESIYNEDFDISKKDFMQSFIENLENKDFFDPTNFILENYIFRG